MTQFTNACLHCNGAGWFESRVCYRCQGSGLQRDGTIDAKLAAQQQDLANAYFAIFPNHWLTRLAAWWDRRSSWQRR